MKFAVQYQNAYADVAAPIRDDRSKEYQAFARITHRLHGIDASDPDHFPALAAVLSENQKLWNILAVDVASDANTLPTKLRAQIFYLSEFTRFHTAKIISEKASPAILVEINTAIMRGLRPVDAVSK